MLILFYLLVGSALVVGISFWTMYEILVRPTNRTFDEIENDREEFRKDMEEYRKELDNVWKNHR